MLVFSKPLKRFILWSVLATIAGALLWTSRYYSLEINLSDSIPYRILWLKKGVMPHKGEWMSFVAPNNGVYPKDTHFTKQMVGAAGDQISYQGRELWINGQYTAYAKQRGKTGQLLSLSQPGIIPTGYYFAHAPHQDSFDSRYQNIGWIHESQILGMAIPLF